MTVHVDALSPCIPTSAWKWTHACHLFSDDIDELHAFAQRLGLRRAWAQNVDGWFPHYDLNEHKRVKAVAMGAAEADRYEAGIQAARRRIVMLPDVAEINRQRVEELLARRARG